VAIVWGYVRPNWWQSGLQEELLDFIEDNTMPDLIEEDLLFSWKASSPTCAVWLQKTCQRRRD
jgi:hypothetical protein